MNENFYQSSSEKLVALLDGELSREEAGSVYYDLAQNPELQEEMHQLLSMKKIINLDKTAPSDSLKSSILLGTGLASDAEILHAEGVAGGATAGLGKVLTGKPFLMVMSALVAFLMTAAYFTNDKTQYNSAIADNTGMTQKTEKVNSVPVVISYSNNDLNGQGNQNAVSPYNSNPFLAANNLSNFTSDFSKSNNNNNLNGEYDRLNYNIPSDNNYKNVHQLFAANIPHTKYAGLPQYSRPVIDARLVNMEDRGFNIDNKFSLGFRGYSFKSYPDLDIQPLSDPIVENYLVSLLWNFDEHHALGLELGQENFDQQFSGTEDGDIVEYQQNWKAFLIGLAYQYKWNDINIGNAGNFNPFVKLFVGGTSVGPVFKGTLGMFYNVNEKLSFVAGIEPTLLRYTYQDKSFNTQKLGFVYGVNINF